MFALFVVYLVALLVLPLRRVALPDLVDRTEHCRSCGYDMAGLDEAANCPECGTVEARVWRQVDRWQREPSPERVVYLLAMAPVWLITLAYSSEVIIWVNAARMVRLGYDAHAAAVWLERGAGNQFVTPNPVMLVVGVPMFILSLLAAREEKTRQRYMVGLTLALVVWILQLAVALCSGLPP